VPRSDLLFLKIIINNNNNNLNEYEVLSHCGFDLKAFFMSFFLSCLYTHFREEAIQVLCSFLSGVVCFAVEL
jgi:hypothetical protein